MRNDVRISREGEGRRAKLLKLMTNVLNMAHGYLSEKYDQQNDDYKTYLENSKLIRPIIHICGILILSTFLTVVIGGIIGLKAVPIDKPVNTIDYYYTLLVVILFVAGFPGFVIFDKILDRIKRQSSYHDINKIFIHICGALHSYHNYLSNNSLTAKNKANRLFKKGYKTIKDWDYGNIPVIREEFKEKINFIKNDFKNITLRMMESDDKNENRNARELLRWFSAFLLYNNIKTLNEFYELAIKYEDRKITSPKKIPYIHEKIIPFIKKYSLLQHALFIFISALLGFIYYYYGIKGFGITKATAYTNAWQIFAILIAGYIAIGLRRVKIE